MSLPRRGRGMGREEKKMNKNLTRWNTFQATPAKTIKLEEL